jgi:transcriptional regulator with PAS, ATPase and Fis domain
MSEPERSRWQRLFSQATDPIFVLNRQRRLLFVNPAWEQLTGLSLRQVRGRSCTAPAQAASGTMEALLGLFAPPPEVLDGQSATIRRLAPGSADQFWEMSFFPFRQHEHFRGLVGKVLPLPVPRTAGVAPLPNRVLALRDRLTQWHRLDGLEDSFPAQHRLREQIRLAGRVREPVWIGGEPGAGKQWVARTIHGLGSTRERYFAAMDCRRLPPAALEQALFGPRGLTGAATAGTIYLQEPQHLPRELQARLCQWLSAVPNPGSPAPPRLLAGCSLDLETAFAAPTLLDEFRCALAVLTIRLPPLRERQAELTALVGRLLRRAPAGTHKIAGLSPEAWDCLRAAAWPENVRELFSVLRQACGRAQGELLLAADLPWYLREPQEPAPSALPLDALLEQVERRLMLLALQRARGNKSRAAEILAIWRGRLIRRLQALGIEEKPDDDSKQGEDEDMKS